MRCPELTPLGLVNFVTGHVVGVVERVAFWIAVAFPVVYLPVLMWMPPAERLPTLAGLVGLHGVILVVGHRYEPRDEYGSDAPMEVSPDG